MRYLGRVRPPQFGAALAVLATGCVGPAPVLWQEQGQTSSGTDQTADATQAGSSSGGRGLASSDDAAAEASAGSTAALDDGSTGDADPDSTGAGSTGGQAICVLEDSFEGPSPEL